MIVNLNLDGQDVGLALVKNVQVNTLHKQIMSIDLQRISLKEQLHIVIPLVLTGEPAGVHAGGILGIERHTVNVTAWPPPRARADHPRHQRALQNRRPPDRRSTRHAGRL